MTTLDIALAYALHGWRVIPITPGKKHPPFDEWQNVATADPEQIKIWWGGKYATYGVSIVQGVASRIFVIDVDVSGGKHGDDTLRYLIDDNGGVWPATVHAITGSGGVHYFFRYPTDGQEIHNSAGKLGPGLDVRAEGGHVVAPPSIHPRTGVAYCWEEGFGPDEIEVAEAPKWLLDQLREIEEPARPAPTVVTQPKDDADEGPAGRFNTNTRWEDLLEPDGWVLDHTDKSGEQHWIRPGKDPGGREGTSATTFHEGRDTLKVFTDGVPFLEQERAYSRFGYVACRDFSGDRSACARWLRSQEDEQQRAEDRAFMAPYPRAHSHGKSVTTDTTAPYDDLLETNTNGNGNVKSRSLRFTDASGIGMKATRWLWNGRIPLREISLLAGREGIGKSNIAYDLVASVTRGKLPGYFKKNAADPGIPRSVVVAASEDSWEQTIIPRLTAAGADLTLVKKVDVVTSVGYEMEVSMPDDIPALIDKMIEHETVLLLLDPVISRLSSSIDTHKDSDVRLGLEPLKRLAGRTEAAILGLIHVNKSSGNDPMNMVMGSRAFTAVARSVLFAFANVDPKDDTVKALGLGKSNLGKLDIPTLLYRIETRSLGYDDENEEITTSKIVWGAEVDKSINDIVQEATEDPEIRGAVDEASEWLRAFLQARGGKYASAEIKDAAKHAEHSHSSIDRARRKLKLTVETSGKTSYWCLPSDKSLHGLVASQESNTVPEAGVEDALGVWH